MKPKSKAKANGAAKGRKKTDKARKPTAAELSDTERQRLLLQHKRKLKPLLLAESAAKDAVRKLYELAKKEGVTKKELEIALLLETDEGTEKVKLQMQRFLDVDRWMGKEIGTQLDMFPKQSTAEKNFDNGKRAALNDEPARPPSTLSQDGQQQWLAGHAEGRTALNTARAEGFRPLGDTIRQVVPPAPVGDQPATHQEAA
jgi:hypothetical protein